MSFYFFTFLCLIGFDSILCAQEKPTRNFSQAEIQEFELLNLCHCLEYLELRNYDYMAWTSEAAKKKYLKEIQGIAFERYSTRGLHSQYYQLKYDSTLFFKWGISIYNQSDLKFNRLDSLYFEPIVQYYVKDISRTENLPYLGFGDRNGYFDCFFKIKEMPIKLELELFIAQNKRP